MNLNDIILLIYMRFRRWFCLITFNMSWLCCQAPPVKRWSSYLLTSAISQLVAASPSILHMWFFTAPPAALRIFKNPPKIFAISPSLSRFSQSKSHKFNNDILTQFVV